MGITKRMILLINKINWWRKSKQLKSGGCRGCIKTGFALVNPEYISIGHSFKAGKNCKLQTWPMYAGQETLYTPNMSIGDNVSIMDNCQISCLDSIEIGDNCLIGDNVFITDNMHGNIDYKDMQLHPTKRKLISKGKISIGANTWIGRNVCIMPGVTIGDGAIIGANAVVTKDIPAYSVAVGVPAKIIRECGRVNYE